MTSKVLSFFFIAVDFLQHFLRHVYKLLKEEEVYGSHWIKADAAKASHMKKSETLR